MCRMRSPEREICIPFRMWSNHVPATARASSFRRTPITGKGQLVRSSAYAVTNCATSTLSQTLYAYDEFGDNELVIADRNFDGAIDWRGPDMIASNATAYVNDGGAWWRERAQYAIDQDDSAELRFAGATRSRLTGLGNGLTAETVSIDILGNATTNRTYRNRTSAEEITWRKLPTSSTPMLTIATNGLVRLTVSETGVTNSLAYDGFDRPIAKTDGRGNVTRTVYDTFGRIAKTIDALGHATTYDYDALNRQIAVIDPLTNTTYTAYDAESRIIRQWGATYPVAYEYDAYGNKVAMTTYRTVGGVIPNAPQTGEPTVGGVIPNAPQQGDTTVGGVIPNAPQPNAPPTGDTTRWLYDEPSGCMTNKLYADGKGPTYTYTPDGKLATRTWARGIVTTYTYDNAGNLTRTEYDDNGVTPTVTLAYNRTGRQTEAHDAAGVTTFIYDAYGANTNETVIGVAGTNIIERYYDTFGRNAGYALNGNRQTALAYDPATGRLVSMRAAERRSGVLTASDNGEFVWNYLPNSDLKASLLYPNGLTASWTYDANNQLLQVCNATPSATISQYDYTYDSAGRRIARAHSGSAFVQADAIEYAYNAKSELTNAVAAVDSNYTYAYDFDEIGNRRTSSECGVRSAEYASNELNQYTAISTDTSALFVSPRETFTPLFDADGNQTLVKTATGTWQVSYNGENRPILWTCGDTNIVMSYDRMGRRVTKSAECGGQSAECCRFVYDGYLQIANHLSTPTLSTVALAQVETSPYTYFIWDPTEPVATRPLVWLNSALDTPHSALYYAHDGNKNVSEVVAQDGDIAAHYEYAPFGAVTAQSGALAMANPWRFSSEFADDELGCDYYNYREYEPMTGRWLNVDPIGESGGVNLFLFAKNALEIDYLGKCKVGEVRSVKFTFEYATEMDNGINFDEMIDAYDKIQIYAWLSVGAGIGSGAAAGAAGGLSKACCQGVTTGVDEGAGLTASNAHDTEGAVDMCKKLAKIMASAYPRIRGLLTYEECVCKKIWFIPYTTWEKKTIGPSHWHELVGGVNFNEGWFPPNSFETEEEAKRNIKEELRKK